MNKIWKKCRIVSQERHHEGDGLLVHDIAEIDARKDGREDLVIKKVVAEIRRMLRDGDDVVRIVIELEDC